MGLSMLSPSLGTIIPFLLFIITVFNVDAQATTASRTIQAVPDSSELSSKGSQAGCDHYRNGYLGLALCVNFYDDTADGKQYVQVVGSMTNEGQVDICNMTLSIAGLPTATYKNPNWLPAYPKTQSFKAGTYFPFTAIIPMDSSSAASYNYPTVDVLRGFFACDASLKALPDDQVVPPPGKGRSSVAADDDYPGSSSANGFGSRIKWAGLVSSAGTKSDCLNSCMAKLNKSPDDCSGCIKSCPSSVADWMINACTKAKCSASQCTLKTSGAASLHNLRHSGSTLVLLLTSVYAGLIAVWAWL